MQQEIQTFNHQFKGKLTGVVINEGKTWIEIKLTEDGKDGLGRDLLKGETVHILKKYLIV